MIDLDKIKFQRMPKFANQLNAFEIKINLIDIECADRLISKMETLIHEVVAWKKRSNGYEKIA